jgi:hypothetical protein
VIAVGSGTAGLVFKSRSLEVAFLFFSGVLLLFVLTGAMVIFPFVTLYYLHLQISLFK